MSILKKYARKEYPEKHDKMLGVRISESLKEEFEEYCHSLNLDVSEAVRLLIKEELKKAKEPVLTYEPQPKPKLNPRPAKRQSSRFTVEPYLNPDGTITCPICQSDVSRSNISRHARDTHGLTTQELLEGSQE